MTLTRDDLEAALQPYATRLDLAGHPTHADLAAALAAHPTHADLAAALAAHPTHADLAAAVVQLEARIDGVASRLDGRIGELEGRIGGMFEAFAARLAPQSDENQLVQQQLDEVRTEVREHTSDLSIHVPFAVRPKRRVPTRRRRRR